MYFLGFSFHAGVQKGLLRHVEFFAHTPIFVTMASPQQLCNGYKM